MIGATIIAGNYAAQARVLESSFLEHHPDACFVTLLVDGSESDRSHAHGSRVIIPADLELPSTEWEQMAGIYDVMELATAVKPAFLRYLLDSMKPSQAVVYLDPDIKVYAPFLEVEDWAVEHGIVLTPHALEPYPHDDKAPSDRRIMLAGIFNLGFIAVGPDARPFLDWWHRRLRVDAVADPAEGLFTDQRWIDWVPAHWPTKIVRDPGFNVAYWNLHERQLTHQPDGSVRVNGYGLRFFHFSGFSPEKPWLLSKHALISQDDNPRITLADDPVATLITCDYVDSLSAAGFGKTDKSPYRLGTAGNGLRLTPLVRKIYRESVRSALIRGSDPPPSPFAPDNGDAFAEWLITPTFGPRRFRFGRWHEHLWRDAPVLRLMFNDPEGADAPRYREWLDTTEAGIQVFEYLRVPPAVIERVASEASSPTVMDHDRNTGNYSWNVVGYFSGELGVGEAARRMNLGFERAGIRTHVVSVGVSSSRSQHMSRKAPSDELQHANTLYCINADQLLKTTATLAVTQPRRAASGRRVGLWFWELSSFPTYKPSPFAALDEIWCSSHFMADAVRAQSPIPVRVVPLPVPEPIAPMPFSRSDLGLPDGFTFLCVYDFNSVVARKNPLGVIDAYTRAFGPGDGASLVLKSINGPRMPEQLARVKFAAMGRPDITVMDGYLDSHRTQGLIEHADCLVSLHRSEGFGLNMAAAMAASVPVIATGYSGNMEFMDAESAFLVPYEIVPVGPGNAPYAAAATWAEPNIDAASEHMRRVFDDRSLAQRVGGKGKQRVLRTNSIDAAARVIGPLLGLPAAPVQSARRHEHSPRIQERAV